MATKSEIEEFFEELGFTYEKPNENVWVGVIDENDPRMAIAYAPPLIILRMKLMEVPDIDNKEDLYRELLEINASEMDHGAYAIENNNVILVDTLQVENLNKNELQASIDSINLAASTAYSRLSKFRQ